MLFLEIDSTSYEEVRSTLFELYPNVKIEKVEDADYSRASGFKCGFSLDMSRADFDNMMYDMLLCEEPAFNEADGDLISDDESSYSRCAKCDWLWNLFYEADRAHQITDSEAGPLQALIDEILSESHTKEEWFELERRQDDLLKTLSFEEQEIYEESGAGEVLYMICSGFRYFGADEEK